MRYIIILVALFMSAESFGQKKQLKQLRNGVAEIDSLTAVARVEFLSCDELEGRYVGTKDAKISAQYIASELKRAGYEPVIERFEKDGLSMQNVYTIIKGESDEIVVVGAHYDHLGVDESGDAYNGADDNASGVAAVLGIGDAIKASGLKPKRTILLGFWDGEEGGLRGSKHFVKSFENIKDVVFYMNFDMIGRNSDEAQARMFRYFYNENKPQYKLFLDSGIKKFGLNLAPDYRPWDNPTSGSDNASFAKIGIPIVWYHTDGHEDYHQVNDTADKINFSKMLDIIKSSYLVCWSVANE